MKRIISHGSLAFALTSLWCGAASAGQGTDACITTGCTYHEFCIPQSYIDNAGNGGLTWEWGACYTPEGRCTKYSRCGHYGPDGACGWQPTKEYQACLAGTEWGKYSCIYPSPELCYPAVLPVAGQSE